MKGVVRFRWEKVGLLLQGSKFPLTGAPEKAAFFITRNITSRAMYQAYSQIRPVMIIARLYTRPATGKCSA